jgi:hypothetical protein
MDAFLSSDLVTIRKFIAQKNIVFSNSIGGSGE